MASQSLKTHSSRKYSDEQGQALILEMFPYLELMQTGEFRVLARPSKFAKTQSKSSKAQSVSRQERKNLEFNLREEAPPLPSQPRHPTTVTIRAVEVASTGARFRQVVAYVEEITSRYHPNPGSHRQPGTRYKGFLASEIQLLCQRDYGVVPSGSVITQAFSGICSNTLALVNPEEKLNQSRWDGQSRKERKDFRSLSNADLSYEDLSYADLGQLCLELDYCRQDRYSANYGACQSGPGFVNTTLQKMSELLGASRTSVWIMQAFVVLGVSDVWYESHTVGAVGTYPDGRLNENVRRYLQKLNDPPEVLLRLYEGYRLGVDEMSAKPNAQITRRQASERYNRGTGNKRKRDDVKFPGEISAPKMISDFQQRYKEQRMTERQVPRDKWEKDEKGLRAARYRLASGVRLS